MMTETTPRVSIGLPVYNGEEYLAETLDSLLAQSYDDFELIICDNGSSDDTEAICRAYAVQDARIRYERYAQNQGAAWNFNRAFELARGEFFKWAAADDLCAPTFLECSVDVLDRDPEAVLAFARCQEIDDKGAVAKSYPSMADLNAPNLFRRFAATIIGPQPFIPVFGLIRRDVLAQTKLIGKYSGSDRPLIGELALRGRLHEIPEFLFFYRVHPQQSWGGGKSHHAQQSWYDPTRLRKITFPHWRLLFEHEHAIWRAPLKLSERIRLHGSILRWVRRKWRFLANNLLLRDAL